MSNKKTYELVKTPVGVAVYPKLTKPDTKFDADGVYSVKLRMPSEVAEKFIAKVSAIHAANVAEQTKINKKKVKEANLPWAEVLDDEGNETGDIEISFKRKAKVTMKDGTKFDVKVALFDSANNQLPQGTDIWGGSELVVAAEVVPYYTAMVGAGVSLRLKAVQVKKLVQGGAGGSNASSFGFEADEDGYVASTKGDNEFSEDDEDEDF